MQRMLIKKIGIAVLLLAAVVLLTLGLSMATNNASATSRTYVNSSLLMLTVGSGGGLGGGTGSGLAGKAIVGQNGQFTGTTIGATISNESQHNCLIAASDNQAYCAGNDGFGQLGNGATISTSALPVKFNLPSGLEALSAGVAWRQTCVLASDNQVYCAGNNGYGQLGNGNTTDQSTPVKFNLPAGLTARSAPVFVNSGAICVTASNSLMYCAGENTDGQLGVNTTTNPLTNPAPVQY